MTESITDRIRAMLVSRNIPFREIHHEPTHTSQESAQARGEDIAIGGKALLMKMEDEFHLFVLSAARKIDSQKIKQHFNVKRLRFATTEELLALTGLVPGSVPPFGSPILPFSLHVDVSIPANDRIAFNAGALTISIIMNCRDYLSIAAPEVFDFSS